MPVNLRFLLGIALATSPAAAQSTEEDIDAELRSWRVEAYAVGEQKHLAKE